MEKIMRIIESNYLLCKKTGLGKISYMGEDRIDGRDTWRIQGVFPKDDGFYAHKITLCFDKVLQLPVKITVCDESNRLIEEYIFRNLRINVGFKDSDFDPENHDYHFFLEVSYLRLKVQPWRKLAPQIWPLLLTRHIISLDFKYPRPYPLYNYMIQNIISRVITMRL